MEVLEEELCFGEISIDEYESRGHALYEFYREMLPVYLERICRIVQLACQDFEEGDDSDECLWRILIGLFGFLEMGLYVLAAGCALLLSGAMALRRPREPMESERTRILELFPLEACAFREKLIFELADLVLAMDWASVTGQPLWSAALGLLAGWRVLPRRFSAFEELRARLALAWYLMEKTSAQFSAEKEMGLTLARLRAGIEREAARILPSCPKDPAKVRDGLRALGRLVERDVRWGVHKLCEIYAESARMSGVNLWTTVADFNLHRQVEMEMPQVSDRCLPDFAESARLILLRVLEGNEAEREIMKNPAKAMGRLVKQTRLNCEAWLEKVDLSGVVRGNPANRAIIWGLDEFIETQ